MVKMYDIVIALSLAASSIHGDDEENTVVIPSVSKEEKNSFEVSFEEYYRDEDGVHDMGSSRYKVTVESLD